jgi:hypothetical protein
VEHAVDDLGRQGHQAGVEQLDTAGVAGSLHICSLPDPTTQRELLSSLLI